MLSVEPLTDELLLVVACSQLRRDATLTLPRRRRQFARLSRQGALLLGWLLGFAAGARWAMTPVTDRRWTGD